MPTGFRDQIQFVRGGDWTNRNESALLHPGELMHKSTIDDKDYITVQLDTGATSATPAGAQAANEVAYFKDRQAGLVTNDARVAEKGIDSVAGIFPCVVTPGYFTALYTGRSRKINVKVDSSAFVAGSGVASDVATNGPQGTIVVAGTALGPGRGIGVARAAAVANVLSVDLTLPDFD